MRIHITLAPNSVLRKSATPGADRTYEIKDNYFTCDTISLNDGVYYSIVNERLADASNPIEIPFQRWTHFSNGSGALSSQTQATLGTESLDVLVGTYQTTNRGTQNDNAVLLAPEFFKTGSANLVSSGFTINNVPYPPFAQRPHDAFESTLQAFNLSQDVLGGTDEGLNSLTRFKETYFLHAIRLNHPTATDERVKSSMNLRGTNATITFTTEGVEADITHRLWAGYTSVLRVAPYKQLEVIP